MVKLISTFMKAAVQVAHFPPPTTPEVAFLGRSNVGKSSLINSLLENKIARVSSSPGRTQTINFYAIRPAGAPRPEVIFADLPGYGYARVPRDITAEWPKFIEPYLRERDVLRLSIVLVDANIPPQGSDRQMVDFLRATGQQLLVVATKTDKLSGNKLKTSLEALRESLGVEDLLPFSTRTGTGKNELWRRIREAVGQT